MDIGSSTINEFDKISSR